VHGAVAQADLHALEAPLAGTVPDRIVLTGRGPLLDAYRHLLKRSPGREPQLFDQPLGAIGARFLYEARSALGAGEGRTPRA
jgi:hypothetical protein